MEIYTKTNCQSCQTAKYTLLRHNVHATVVKVSGVHDIIKRFPDIDLDSEHVSYFPIFKVQDDCRLYDTDKFIELFGEPMLTDNPNRHVLFPVQYPSIWNMYEKALASFWTVNEIDFAGDCQQFDNDLSDNERHFVKNVLAFFAASDGIINENLARNFSDEVQIPEARAFYSYQQFNETIHSHTYSLMIDRFIKNNQEKQRLFQSIFTIPSIQKKANWALKWIDKDTTPCFAKRLVAFACVEGIMFSGSFCAIYWLKKRGLMPGLSFSNELISRDEGTHQEFAVLLYSMLRNKLTGEEVYEIVKEAVSHEQEFITSALPCNLVGMNSDMMTKYIEYIADRLVLQLGYPVIYKSENPFDFMETISLCGKTNFFEKRVGEYAKAGVMSVSDTDQTFSMVEDF